jgi:hypothetical protein
MMRKVFWAASLLLCACHRNEAVTPDPKADDTALEQMVDETDVLFGTREVPKLSVEIPEEGMKILRSYRQVWRQARPERIDAKATIRDGENVYTDVAIHLKGTFTFQPIDARPSLTLNFEKFAKGQKFHGLSKLHLNNTVQDPSYLSEAFARDLFNDIGVPAPRAGHAIVTLNGRPLGLYVLIEGAGKPFLKRHFESIEGNLYDADAGGEITKEMDVESGEHREDRSELDKLAEAAEEPDSNERWARLEELLDVDEFLSFVAAEVLLVHWDGYSTGAPNNYRVFHDVGRGKFAFIPQGLDQLLRSGTSAQKLTPHFTGLVARGLMTTPEGRRRYLARIASLAGKEFGREALLARVERIAAPVRAALAGDRETLENFDNGVNYLKASIAERTNVVARLLLQAPPRPIAFDASNEAKPSDWQFKASNTRPATGRKVVVDNHPVLQVVSRGPETVGSWRTLLLLEDGNYEFTGRARTEGFDPSDANGTNGVNLRISGEKFPVSSESSQWITLHYEFEVHGIEDVELVCEFKGAQGVGSFDPASMRLIRKP